MDTSKYKTPNFYIENISNKSTECLDIILSEFDSKEADSYLSNNGSIRIMIDEINIKNDEAIKDLFKKVFILMFKNNSKYLILIDGNDIPYKYSHILSDIDSDLEDNEYENKKIDIYISDRYFINYIYSFLNCELGNKIFTFKKFNFLFFQSEEEKKFFVKEKKMITYPIIKKYIAFSDKNLNCIEVNNIKELPNLDGDNKYIHLKITVDDDDDNNLDNINGKFFIEKLIIFIKEEVLEKHIDISIISLNFIFNVGNYDKIINGLEKLFSEDNISSDKEKKCRILLEFKDFKLLNKLIKNGFLNKTKNIKVSFGLTSLMCNLEYP